MEGVSRKRLDQVMTTLRVTDGAWQQGTLALEYSQP